MDNVITKQETTEVLDNNGNTLNSGDSPLASIFDRIESGKEEGKSAVDVVGEKPSSMPAKTEKPAAEPAPEVKTELDKKLDKVESVKQDDGDISRDKLRAATEPQKQEESKAEPEKTPTDDVPEAELQVQPYDKPKTAKRIAAILAKVKKAEMLADDNAKQAKEKADKLAELEKQLATVKSADPTTDERVKKQLDELAMYRRRYDLERDPEIKTKFETRFEQAEASIKETLVRHKANDGMLKLINDAGGWVKFSESNAPIAIADGEGGVRNVPASELADEILKALPLGDRKHIEVAMMEQLQTKREKDRFFKEEQEKASQFFKQREDEEAKARTENEKAIEDAKKKIDTWRETTMNADWLKDKSLPEGATPEQKTEVEQYNRYNAQLRALLVKTTSTKDIDSLLEMAADSVRYYDERRRSYSLAQENERLKADLAKFKGAGRSVPRQGSIAAAPVASDSKDSKESKKPRSLEEAFEAMERGESLTGASNQAE